MSANTSSPKNMDLRDQKNLATVIYALQAGTFPLVITYFIAPMVIYWKKDDVAGTWLESHLRWQLNTFWYSLVWFAVGFALLPLGPVGLVISIAGLMWFVFRIVQGWSRLSLGNPMFTRAG